MDEISFVNMMTDEQIEILKEQIVVYATISEQLLQLHNNSITSHNDLAGARLGNQYYCRQRWHPNDEQLQILKCLYEQDKRTPDEDKIQEIASDLSRHGMITTKTNVDNWFQNMRARSKKKQQAVREKKSTGSEVEISFNKRRKPKDQVQLAVNEDVSFQNIGASSSGVTTIDPHSNEKPVEASSNLGIPFAQMPFYDDMLPYPGLDDLLMGKIDVSCNYYPCLSEEDENIFFDNSIL